jgi:hypothetical protein
VRDFGVRYANPASASPIRASRGNAAINPQLAQASDGLNVERRVANQESGIRGQESAVYNR